MSYKKQLISDINRLYIENEVTNTSSIDCIVNDILENSPNDELIRGISANWHKRSKSIELVWDINQYGLFQVDVNFRIFENNTSWSIQYLFKRYNETRNEGKTFIEHLNMCLSHIRQVKKNFESKLKTKGEFYEELIKKIDWHIASSIRDKEYNATQMVLGVNLNNYRPEINVKELLLNHDIYDLTDYTKCFFIDPNDGVGFWELKNDTLFWELAEKYIEEDEEETRISQIKKITKITSDEFRRYFYKAIYQHLAELNAIKSGRMPIYLKIFKKSKKKRFFGVEHNSLRPFIGILEGLDGCDLYDLEKIEEAFLTDDNGYFVSTNNQNSKFILKDKSLINLLVQKYFTEKNECLNLPLIKTAEESTIHDESLFVRRYNTIYTDKFCFYSTIVGKYSDVSFCDKYCYRPKSLCEFVDFLETSLKKFEEDDYKAATYFHKAKEHKKNRKYKNAITALEKAIILVHNIDQTGRPEIHSCLIDCYAKIKDKENQIRVIRHAIELYDSPKYKSMLNRVQGTISDTTLNNTSYQVNAKCNYGKMYDEHIRRVLPEFNFGRKHIDLSIFERPNMLPVIRKIDKHFQDTFKKAKDAEMLECYEGAVQLYEQLITEGVYTPNAYERLIVLYSKSKREKDLIRILQTGISYFEKRKSGQAEYIMSLAKKYGLEEDCMQRIRNGEKIRYYCGYIVLYQDFPFIEKWKKRLAKLLS